MHKLSRVLEILFLIFNQDNLRK